VPLDLSMTKLVVLGIVAMVVFGPDKLPQLARDAGRMLRQFREIANQARADLKSELGDTVGDFDFADLNPKTFVRKHLLDDPVPDAGVTPAAAQPSAVPAPPAPHAPVPFDADAT
jgi:sec-independent protein translocase protein TatB